MFCWDSLRSCSYGSQPAQLGGLAHLSEISPSLKNFCKSIVCSYEKCASRQRWDLTFVWIPPRWDEHFPSEHAQVGQPASWDRVFFSTHSYVFELLPNSILKWLRQVPRWPQIKDSTSNRLPKPPHFSYIFLLFLTFLYMFF